MLLVSILFAEIRVALSLLLLLLLLALVLLLLLKCRIEWGCAELRGSTGDIEGDEEADVLAEAQLTLLF